MSLARSSRRRPLDKILIVEKELNGFADRDDIQTYVDLHDTDEGRTPKYAAGSANTFAFKF
jgi:hypothetical protein